MFVLHKINAFLYFLCRYFSDRYKRFVPEIITPEIRTSVTKQPLTQRRTCVQKQTYRQTESFMRILFSSKRHSVFDKYKSEAWCEGKAERQTTSDLRPSMQSEIAISDVSGKKRTIVFLSVQRYFWGRIWGRENRLPEKIKYLKEVISHLAVLSKRKFCQPERFVYLPYWTLLVYIPYRMLNHRFESVFPVYILNVETPPSTHRQLGVDSFHTIFQNTSCLRIVVYLSLWITPLVSSNFIWLVLFFRSSGGLPRIPPLWGNTKYMQIYERFYTPLKMIELFVFLSKRIKAHLNYNFLHQSRLKHKWITNWLFM